MTLPLYEGQMLDGISVWYCCHRHHEQGQCRCAWPYLTGWSPKLAYSTVGLAARIAVLETDGTLTFACGTVDFSPEHQVTPGEILNPFPPC